MRMSPVVCADREAIKSCHDKLVQAWEDGSSHTFEEAMQSLQGMIGTVPRKSYGSRKIYEGDGHQPAKAVLIDPALEDIECID